MIALIAYILRRSALPCLFALSALLAASAPCRASSCSVVIVKSADLKPYQEAAQGIRDVSECAVREITLGPGEGAERILRTGPGIIVAVGTTAFRTVKTITDLPVVHVMAVAAESGEGSRNLSGVIMNVAPENYVAAMRGLLPGARRVGIFYDPRSTAKFFRAAERAVRAAGMEPVSREVRDPARLPPLLSELEKDIDVFWMLPDPAIITEANVRMLLGFSFRHSVPIITFSDKYLDMGAVVSLNLDAYEMGKQAGEIANRLAVSGGGPIREYARYARTAVNRTVAGKMGLVLSRQSRVEGAGK